MFNRIRMIMAVALAQAFGGKTPLSLQRMASDHNRAVDAVRGAPVIPKVNGYEHVLARVRKSFRMRSPGKRYTPNGAQECARRVRQMARGNYQCPILWVDSQGRRWTTNSHGQPCGFGWASGLANPGGTFV